MRTPRAREWLVGVAARLPRTHALLRRVARLRAGRHHVAAVAVVLHGSRVLVGEHAFRAGVWGLPSGWVNAGEDPFRAVEREVREELGLVVTAVELVGGERQGTDPPARRRPSAIAVAFLCLPVGPPGDLVVSAELRSARWVELAEAPRYLSTFERRSVEAAVRIRNRPAARSR